jgi:hypothetical protein
MHWLGGWTGVSMVLRDYFMFLSISNRWPSCFHQMHEFIVPCKCNCNLEFMERESRSGYWDHYFTYNSVMRVLGSLFFFAMVLVNRKSNAVTACSWSWLPACLPEVVLNWLNYLGISSGIVGLLSELFTWILIVVR